MKDHSILIVEDNHTYRRSLADFLAAKIPSAVIRQASRDSEAFQEVRKSVPGIVFMDIKMPGMNGLTITRQLKDMHPDITVIVLTSYDLPEYREAAFRVGASHFFTKGTASGDEIVSLVSSLLARAPAE